MDDEHPDSDSESQRRFDELSARVAANRADIDELQARADASADAANHRAELSQARADASDARADAIDARADEDRGRIDKLEARADINERVIAELQADGLLSRKQAGHLKEALGWSRIIGAAVGIIMERRKVSEEAAFETLVKASNHTNRKLRIIADDVVRTGDLSYLPSP